MDTSPIVPPVKPRNISVMFTGFPAFNSANGVAPVMPSTEKVLIVPANEINKKHLAASAGFIKFCPKPPNSCFTNKIANILPIIGIHHGTSGERFNANNKPVTNALPSVIVTF